MKELAKALATARSTMGGTVHKGGTNAHQKYPYVGHEHVMTSGAREALQLNGLSLVQTGVELVGEVPGGKVQVLLWRGIYQLMHSSGESIELTYLASTQCNDKAAFVASTSLDRTAFLRVLALAGSSEEDPEHDTHDRGRWNGNGQQSTRAQARQADSAEEREQAKVSAELSLLSKSLRDPKINTAAQVAELQRRASALKPRLNERQVEVLAVDMRAAIARVREAEAAEKALSQPEAQGQPETQQAVH